MKNSWGKTRRILFFKSSFDSILAEISHQMLAQSFVSVGRKHELSQTRTYSITHTSESVRKSFCHFLSDSGKKAVKSPRRRHLVSHSANTDCHNTIRKCSSFSRPCCHVRRESYFTCKILKCTIYGRHMYVCQHM